LFVLQSVATFFANIFVINIFLLLSNIFQKYSNIFQKHSSICQKYWFRQLFFVNILQNAATFFKNVVIFFFERKTNCRLSGQGRVVGHGRARGQGRPATGQSSTCAARAGVERWDWYD
jgi:hypothetical protein